MTKPNSDNHPNQAGSVEDQRQANKSILAESVAHELNLPRRTATIVLDSVLDSITDLLRQRGRVAIKGFGTFERKIRKGRSYTHPLTRKSIQVDDKETIMFRVSDQLTDAITGDETPRRKSAPISPDDLSQFN
jgi:nucleoid DNA-binding protein